MLTDPALAELPLIIYVEPEGLAMSVLTVTPDQTVGSVAGDTGVNFATFRTRFYPFRTHSHAMPPRDETL